MEGAATSANILSAQMNPFGSPTPPKKKKEPAKKTPKPAKASSQILQALLAAQPGQQTMERNPL